MATTNVAVFSMLLLLGYTHIARSQFLGNTALADFRNHFVELPPRGLNRSPGYRGVHSAMPLIGGRPDMPGIVPPVDLADRLNKVDKKDFWRVAADLMRKKKAERLRRQRRLLK